MTVITRRHGRMFQSAMGDRPRFFPEGHILNQVKKIRQRICGRPPASSSQKGSPEAGYEQTSSHRLRLEIGNHCWLTRKNTENASMCLHAGKSGICLDINQMSTKTTVQFPEKRDESSRRGELRISGGH